MVKAKIEDYYDFNLLKEQLHNVLYEGNPTVYKVKMDEYGLDAFSDEIQKGNVYMYKDKNINIGYVHFCVNELKNVPSMKDRVYMFLLDICVHENYRRNGIGKNMFSELTKIAKEKKCTEIIFNVFSFNSNAIEFYKRMNCEINGIGMNYKV